MPKRILVIGGRAQFLAKARALDVEIWSLQQPAAATQTVPGDTGATILFDYQRRAECVRLVEALHRAFPFAAVVSPTEDALLVTAQINDRLGLGGTNEDTVLTLLDKSRMRARLAAAGLSIVASAVCRDAEDLERFIDQVGYPVIVKPLAGSGSFGVRRIVSPDDIAGVIALYRTMDVPAFIAEEFLDGAEVSAEAFSFGGQHQVIAVTDKESDAHFVEMAHAMPSRITPALEQDVIDLVEDFLDCVGIQDGPSHTEVKLTSRGPRIIEGHNRRGGDRITEMIQHSFGFDIEQAQVAWAAGLMAPLTERPSAVAGAAVRFFSAPRGTLTSIEGRDEAAAMEGVAELHVNFDVGDYLGTVEQSTDRPGYVTVFAADAATALDIAERSAATTEFVTDGSERDTTERLRELSSQLDMSWHVDEPTLTS